MKSLTETYTPLIKSLLDLNQEIRLRLSSMHSYTEQEIQSLEAWLVEAQALAKDCEDRSLIISHHLRLLNIALQERQKPETT